MIDLKPFLENPADESPAVCAAQWRVTVLRLSRVLTLAAAERPALATVLMEAFDNALEQLLLFGCESDWCALETWLAQENA